MANGSEVSLSPKNQLYAAYSTAGPSLALILPAIPLCIIAAIGITLNAFVVFVTLKTKTLRAPTNLLLALLCAWEMLHQLCHFQFLFIVTTGVNFVDLSTAVWIALPSLFGLNAALMAMTCAAVDRLFAVLADKIRDQLNICLYTAIHASVTVIYGAYFANYFVLYAQQFPEAKMTGCITDIMTGQAGKTFFAHTAALCAISSVCYLVVWLFVRNQSYVSQQTSARLFKSLVLILCVNIGGYIVNLSALQVILYVFEAKSISISHLHLWHISFVSSYLMNICVAANAPILYANSTDYRSAFSTYMKLFSGILLLKRNTATMVHPLSMANSSRPNPNNEQQQSQSRSNNQNNQQQSINENYAH